MRALVYMNQNIRTAAGRRRSCVVVKAEHHVRGIHGRAVRWWGHVGGVRAQVTPTKRIASHDVHAWVEVEAPRIQVLRGGKWQEIRSNNQ